jgi:hypothetical protein
MTQEERLVKKCLLNWEHITETFISSLDKELGNISIQILTFGTSLAEVQKRFAKHFERQNDTTYLLIKFIENYGRFSNEQPGLLAKQYTKDQLNKKTDLLHDQIWDIIQRQKEVALEEKENIAKTGWINKEVDKIMQSLLRFSGCELNNIHYKRIVLQSYYALNENKNETDLGYDVEDIKLDPKDLPDIDYEEFVPFERIDSIMSCFELYKEINLRKLQENTHRVPADISECLKIELDASGQRLLRAKTFIINKIKKLKIKYSCFLHRLEDWIVHSIKTENKFIYGLIQKVRDCILNETPQIEFHLKFFDPLTDYDLVDFSLGPHIVSLPPEEDDHDDYFNSSQLFFIMTDLSNLTPQFTKNSKPKALDFAYTVNHFMFRIKNNDIGLLKMFPSSWIGKNPQKI